MSVTRLEHSNITVSDPAATAAWLTDVFGWTIRWDGPAMTTGRTIHCGTDDTYVALFTHEGVKPRTEDSYRTIGGLNHVAVFTDDIDGVEQRVRNAGFAPVNHSDYAPGRRFYFHDRDSIEWEVASHQS